jgi:type IV/VI secretion system ImpK/VasF family protein
MYFKEWNSVYALLDSLNARCLAPRGHSISSQPQVIRSKNHQATALKKLASDLSERCGEQEIQLVIHALIFMCDEIMLTQEHSATMRNAHKEPQRLQHAFLKINNGGEVFFTLLDKVLIEPKKYQFALEVFYFCLVQGFKGCYLDDASQLAHYTGACVTAIKANTKVRLRQQSGSLSHLDNAERREA